MKYRNSKDKKNASRMSEGFNSRLVALDRDLKNMKNTANFNKNIFNAGGKWFEEGFDLEEADEKLREDDNFIDGYHHMERLYDINDILYKEGSNYYLSGKDLSSLPVEKSNNKYFLEGYRDAMSLDNKKKR